jgi:E3 ubiquitin-protein ligase SHPRH
MSSSFEGCADVLSISQHTAVPLNRDISDSSLDAQDASSNLSNLRSLFAAHSEDGEPAQRAQKRRKVDNDNAVSIQARDMEEERSIVLARVCLELVSAVVPSLRDGD